MRSTSLGIVVFLSIALLFSGCAKKETRAVAKVGDRVITLEQLQNRLGSVQFTSRDLELSRKKELLESLIDEQLMVIGAYQAGLDKDPDILSQFQTIERNALLEALYKAEVLNKTQPSEKEMKDYYEKTRWQVKASHILVPTEEEAAAISEQLSAGADFAQLAKEKSTDPGTKEKGGDLGFFDWGRMVSPFRDTAFAKQPGTISKPVQTRYGWHIIKVEDRREAEVKSFEEQKNSIESTLSREKAKERSEEYLTALKDNANIRLQTEAIQVILEKFLANKQTPEEYTDEQKEMTLVVFRGGQWTVETFLTELSKVPPMYRPRVKDSDDLDVLVRNILTGQLLEAEARKRGLLRNKEVADKIRMEKENTLIQTFRQKGVSLDTTVTEEDIQTYYQDHQDVYTTPEQVKVSEIQVNTEQEARDILKQLRAGANFSKLAGDKSVRSWAAKKGGDLGYLTRRRYPAISEAAFELKVGQLGGPVKDGNKYSIIKVTDKKEATPKALQEVSQTIVPTIRRERQEKATEQWLQDMRQQQKVEIFTDVLESTLVTEKQEAA